jgi:pimeloyl-ACP methyl ester carboxylesterase
MTAKHDNGIGPLDHKTIDGLKIRFARGGTADGNPILLLSPWPESLLAFLPTWETFAALGPVLAVDLPAFGRSESRPNVRAPEAMGEFLLRIMDAFGLHQPHVAAPDIGTPSALFAAANHPGSFKSLIIGSGATNHRDIGGILDELVNSPSLEPYKNLTGEQFVRGATDNMKKHKLPDYVLQDYLASYAVPDSLSLLNLFVTIRNRFRAWPAGSKRSTFPARSSSDGMIPLYQSLTPKDCSKGYPRASLMCWIAVTSPGKTVPPSMANLRLTGSEGATLDFDFRSCRKCFYHRVQLPTFGVIDHENSKRASASLHRRNSYAIRRTVRGTRCPGTSLPRGSRS